MGNKSDKPANPRRFACCQAGGDVTRILDRFADCAHNECQFGEDSTFGK